MPKATGKRAEALKTWCHKAYAIHWADLAPVSNSRQLFVNYVVRDNPDDKTLVTIKDSIIAWGDYWQKQSKKEKVIGVPCLSTWYNGGRYNDPVPTTEVKGSTSVEYGRKCSVIGCNEPVHGSGYNHCAGHLPSSYSGAMLDVMKANNLT